MWRIWRDIVSHPMLLYPHPVPPIPIRSGNDLILPIRIWNPWRTLKGHSGWILLQRHSSSCYASNVSVGHSIHGDQKMTPQPKRFIRLNFLGTGWPSGLGRWSRLLRSAGCGFNSRRHPVTRPSLPTGLLWTRDMINEAVTDQWLQMNGAMVGNWQRSWPGRKRR